MLFVAGYLAYYVRPTFFWWFELVAVFLPYISMVVVAATIVVIALRRWPLALLHGVLILLMVIRMNPFARFATGAGGESVSVLTYNVPRWWGYHMSAKTAGMGELIRRADPDVIGLQEAPVAYHDEAPYLRAAPYVALLFDSLGYRGVGPRGKRQTSTPQPVFSKHRLIRQDTFELRRKPADGAATEVTRTQIRWRNREFVVYNVHLRTFGEKPWHEERLPFLEPKYVLPYLRQYRDAYRERAWEVEEIVKMVEREDLPVVLCGDLNSTPNNWVHRRMTDVMRDAFRQAGSGWGMTYHTHLPIVRIDYVFVSEEWEVVSARVLDAYLSDHLPLLVEIRLKVDG